MSELRAWLEFIDEQTGSPRRVDFKDSALSIGRTGGDLRLLDAELSDIHAILSKEGESFILRDLGSKAGTFLNDRPVIEAELTHLDQIRMGHTTLIFMAAYQTAEKSNTAPFEHVLRAPPAQSEVTREIAAPGRSMANTPQYRTLVPLAMLLHPLRFWTQALATGVFEFRRTWLGFLLTVLITIAGAFFTGGGIPLLALGFLVFSASIALILIAVTCSVFFAFESAADTPHGLSHAMRFTFWLAPFLLFFQLLFLTWATRTHPHSLRYFMGALLPTTMFWVFVSFQSRYAFSVSHLRAAAFAITASVPWSLLMTGLMSFLV